MNHQVNQTLSFMRCYTITGKWVEGLYQKVVVEGRRGGGKCSLLRQFPALDVAAPWMAV